MDAAAVVGRLLAAGFSEMRPRLRLVARVRRRGTGLVAAARAQLEVAVEVGDAVEIGRPVPQLLDHEMDHDAVPALHVALDLARTIRRAPMTIRR